MGPGQDGAAARGHHPLPAPDGPWPRPAPASRALGGEPCQRALPTGPRWRVLGPLGHMCQGIGREALWHLRHANRPGVSHGGVVCSSAPVPPHSSCGANRAAPLRENTQQGPGVDRPGSSAGPGRLPQGKTPHGVHSQALAPACKGAERRSPPPHWPLAGPAGTPCSGMPVTLRRARRGAQRPCTRSAALCLDLRSGSRREGDSRGGFPWAAPPPRLPRTGER